VLTIASDGASYLITLAGVGLLFGVAADRRRETPSAVSRAGAGPHRRRFGSRA
jgi:hypothetical protein